MRAERADQAGTCPVLTWRRGWHRLRKKTWVWTEPGNLWAGLGLLIDRLIQHLGVCYIIKENRFLLENTPAPQNRRIPAIGGARGYANGQLATPSAQHIGQTLRKAVPCPDTPIQLPIAMTIRDIATVLEGWAPPPVAESYDNVGLLCGHPDQPVSGVLINLDATEAVVDEAIARGLNLVVAHHPIWFSGRKRLNGEDYVSRTIIKAIKHDIALYACHTNLDNVRDGVNHMMAQRLGLVDTQFLRPKADPTYGSGLIGQLPQPLPKADFLQQVKAVFQCGGIRYADAPLTQVQRVALCGGAGSFLTHDALAQKADALVTADITYHKFFDNEEQMLLLDIGHYESEQYTSELIASYLSNNFPNFAVHLSEVRTNPVQYL